MYKCSCFCSVFEMFHSCFFSNPETISKQYNVYCLAIGFLCVSYALNVTSSEEEKIIIVLRLFEMHAREPFVTGQNKLVFYFVSIALSFVSLLLLLWLHSVFIVRSLIFLSNPIRWIFQNHHLVDFICILTPEYRLNRLFSRLHCYFIIQNVQIDLSFVDILFIEVHELGQHFPSIDSCIRSNLGIY